LAHQLSGFNTGIESVDLDTGQEQKLTEITRNSSVYESYCYASFSPAGDRLVCLHARMDDSGSADISLATMSTNGSNRTDFYNIGYTNKNPACPPTWFPDGTKVAFIGRDLQVWTVAAGGTGAERLTNIGDACYFPNWAPDGSLVAFNSMHNDYPYAGNIYSVVSKGGNASKLTGDSTDSQPKWFRGSSPAPHPTSRTWGHDSIGVSKPANDWYLAEGCTGAGFETWTLVQNPNGTAVNVEVSYLKAGGGAIPDKEHPGQEDNGRAGYVCE